MRSGFLVFLRFLAFAVIGESLKPVGRENGASNAKIDGICSPSSCGDILNISSPFRLKSDPENCGNSRYELSCENNLTVLYLYSVKYLVKAINYNNYTIRIVDANVQKDNCSSIPNHSLNEYDFMSYDDAYDTYQRIQPKTHPSFDRKLTKAIIFLKCENRMNSSLYIDTAPCNIAGMFPNQDTGANSSLSKRQSYYYVVDGSLLNVSDLNNYCRIELTTLMSRNRMNGKTNTSYVDIHNELAYGFELSWLPSFLQQLCSGASCYIGDSNKVHCSCYRPQDKIGLCLIYLSSLLIYFGMYTGAKFVFGAPVVVVFLIYNWRRRHLSTFNSIEEFLHSHNNLMPIRYSYSDIKKMTKNFKNKLGEGGYGSVFKGKLRSGHLVAIKMLSNSKGKGQDFINEIATIGRIHHVHVVQLIGFCSEGSKHALVYDFMSNGSLD
ncbi:hypothetical protein TIFTF001_048850, partial [Ficus carica]